MKNRLESNEIYYAIIIPSYAVAPDGTLLFPRKMSCGCQIIEQLNKASKPDKEHIIMSIRSCEQHKEIVTLQNMKITMHDAEEHFFWTDKRSYVIVKGELREKILHGEEIIE